MSETREAVVVEVTDGDFEERVVEGSRERPVVVDLWAAWCAPCRTLGPILEKVAEEKGGAFLLAKLDVDANPMTAAAFGVQSIPTVIAFRDGRPVDGFVGAYPEPFVRGFVERLLPSEGDLVAREAAAQADPAEAERRFRSVLEDEPGNREARLGLGRLLLERGARQEARETLSPLLPDPEAERLLAAAAVAGWGEVDDADPLAGPKRLAAEGRWREALDGLLGAVVHAPDLREQARAAMLEVFRVLGEEDPLTAEFRRRLASALF
ncbi:MAG TPA: tetratricopeptide repeat protein [Actinomycetota bacterium]|nr:tetratricopeptide repeat protein [Actinomycetota bacterium]